ncbi:MAG: hypothetical protein BroJett029_40920 [Alphaproteobacteria bacterium]|nr:MAG: hypothetical protein BroJett029_40920 [Alphaproteobacteria bacterium]
MVHRIIRRMQPDDTARALARGLGWFSIALGLAELIAPRRLTRTLGMEDHAGLAQLYGLREIVAGIGLLLARDPLPWVWGRVAGDALDLASLAPALHRDNPERHNAGLALGAVAAVTLLDICCARQLAGGHRPVRRRLRSAAQL